MCNGQYSSHNSSNIQNIPKMKPYETVQNLYGSNYKSLQRVREKNSQIEQYNTFFQGNGIL